MGDIDRKGWEVPEDLFDYQGVFSQTTAETTFNISDLEDVLYELEAPIRLLFKACDAEMNKHYLMFPSDFESKLNLHHKQIIYSKYIAQPLRINKECIEYHFQYAPTTKDFELLEINNES